MTPRLLRRMLGAGILAGVALAGAATPAAAAGTGHIVSVQDANGSLQLVFAVQGLGAGQTVDPASVKVSIEGRDVSGVSATRAGEDAAVKVDRTAVLVMDVSGSMNAGQPTKIASAKQAAQLFLGAVPADVKVGLVTFNDRVRTVVAPTTNRVLLRSAIRGLTASDGTALYDGVVQGINVAGASGVRNVVLLSDGADDGSSSRATLATAAAAVKNSKVTLDAVALGGDARPAVLRSLAAGGRVISATGAAQLSDAFKQAAQAISNQLLVTVPLPNDLGATSGNVTVSASAAGGTVTDTAFASFTGGNGSATADPQAYGPKEVAEPKPWVTEAMLPLALGGMFLGLLVLLVVALTSVARKDPKEGRVRRRLSIYTLTGRQPVKQHETTALGDSNVARSAVELAGKVVARRDFEEVLGARLEAAGVPLRPAEWLLIHVGATLGLGLLFLLLFAGSLVPALLGVAIGFLVPWVYLSFKETRRLNSFLAQLPDTLQLLAGSLSAGYSLPQAVDTVVREGQVPITTEFNRALVEARLGVPLEDALDGIATRMKSKDFAWVVMAIRIQREVGGNLAEVLTTVSGTLRERERLRRQVQVLSAEGRLSAWILGALPMVFAVYLILVRREYLRPLYTELFGYLLIGMGVTFLTVGIFWLRKVVKVEV